MNERAVAGKTPAILRNYHFNVLTFLLVSFLAVVAPTVIPNQNDDDKALEDWMVAVIASVAGVVLIVILVFLIYWFTIRNKADGGKEIHKKLLISAFNSRRVGHYLLVGVCAGLIERVRMTTNTHRL